MGPGESGLDSIGLGTWVCYVQQAAGDGPGQGQQQAGLGEKQAEQGLEQELDAEYWDEQQEVEPQGQEQCQLHP